MGTGQPVKRMGLHNYLNPNIYITTREINKSISIIYSSYDKTHFNMNMATLEFSAKGKLFHVREFCSTVSENSNTRNKIKNTSHVAKPPPGSDLCVLFRSL